MQDSDPLHNNNDDIVIEEVPDLEMGIAINPIQQDDTEMVTAPVSGEQSAIKIDTSAKQEKPETKFELFKVKDIQDFKPCLVDDA
jgi:hypothetical protein